MKYKLELIDSFFNMRFVIQKIRNIVVVVSVLFGTDYSLYAQEDKRIVMDATVDFPVLKVDGFVPANKKDNSTFLSVNAGKYKDVFAAVNGSFFGKTGVYDITLNTLKEFDGESSYRVRIDGKIIGTYQNPRTDKAGDFTPSKTTFTSINVTHGALIQVEFNSHTNGLIPENGGTAYARGRWSSLIFEHHHSDLLQEKLKSEPVSSSQVPYFTGDNPTPEGKKWEAVSALSDEFDGPEIDNTKWVTDPAAHPHLKWHGRQPALFQSKNLKIKNQELTIEVGKLPKPVTVAPYNKPTTYEFYGGILRSKATTNVGNYYECRMKMNKTEMGGGFWLMGFNSACDKKHEIDISESVGVMSDLAPNWAKNKGWDNIFHANTIRREDPCQSDQSRDSGHVKTATKNHEKYYVFGCWRKSATELLFYMDGEYQFTLTPPVPFDQDMYMQFSIESYHWNPFPLNGSKVETASVSDRTTHVDYIRTFKLTDL